MRKNLDLRDVASRELEVLVGVVHDQDLLDLKFSSESTKSWS